MKKLAVGIFISFVVLITFTCFPMLVYAQGGPGGPGDPYCDPLCNCRNGDINNVCPIDSWIYVLVAAGAVYGAIKFRTTQKMEASVS